MYLSQRLAKHVWSSKNEKDKMCKSKQIIDRGDYVIILIEACICETKEQLIRRERHFIESMTCVNMNIPSRTRKEWREDNADKVDGYNRKYREANKENSHKWREKNKEKMSEYNRIYYLKKKEAKSHTLPSMPEPSPPIFPLPSPSGDVSVSGKQGVDTNVVSVTHQ